MRKLWAIRAIMGAALGFLAASCAYAQYMPPGGTYVPPPSGGGNTPPPSGGGTYTPPAGGGGSVQYAVTVQKIGTGSGMVAGGSSIQCGSSCTASIMQGMTLMLTAAADSGSSFVGWSGDCSGSSASCTVVVSGNMSVTAQFDANQSTGLGGGDTGNGNGGGSGSDTEYVSSTGASYFYEQIKEAAPKIRKRWAGYTPVIGQIAPRALPFVGSVLGTNWRFSTASGEPVAQGSLTGPGSHMAITANLYTGDLGARFDGKTGCWMVSYDTGLGNERKSFYRCKGDVYQEESVLASDGMATRVALLMHGPTLFASFGEDGDPALFAVSPGTIPDALPASWKGAPVPKAKDPLVPMQKLLDFIPKKAASLMRDVFAPAARAADKALTSLDIFGKIGEYKAVSADLVASERSFLAMDIFSADADMNEVDVALANYQYLGTRVRTVRDELGRAAIFIRDGGWTWGEAGTVPGLRDAGIEGLPANFLMQVPGESFDFYMLKGPEGAREISRGSCARVANDDGSQSLSCVKGRVSEAQARAVAKAGVAYARAVSEARGVARGIEDALFLGTEK